MADVSSPFHRSFRRLRRRSALHAGRCGGAKARLKAGERTKPLEGKVLAMIFDKPSTRTRVSFDVGMRQLGGETIMLTGTEMQLGRSETIGDTAKVLSRYVDAIMIRTTSHERLLELTENATVPVINALTDDTHPCQLMADIMTFEEHRGPVAGKTIAWTGDGNNVLHSLLEARNEGAEIMLSHDADRAVAGADCVVTDTWVSMNQEHRARGHNVFQPYQVNSALMARPARMHCSCIACPPIVVRKSRTR
jgi:ornithine carbamoyltransferase